MLHVILENQYTQQLDLLNSPDYDLLQVTGITPPVATINTNTIATKDGSAFNSSRLGDRNIILVINPKGSIEQSRLNLYKFIQPKKYIKLYLKNGHRDVWIDGYVESFDGDLYAQIQQFQVSIICPDPYFKSRDASITNFSVIEPLFTFPFSITSEGTVISQINNYTERNIVNDSDSESGVVIDLYARDLVLEPSIYNLTTGESFTINHEFQPGDLIRINSRQGEKSLKLIHQAVEINVLNQMNRGSKWLTLAVGDNIFTYTALFGVENLQMIVQLQPIYTGV